MTDQLQTGTLTIREADVAPSEHGGLLALRGERQVGTLVFEPHEHLLGIRRLAVSTGAAGAGVAGALVGRAERVANERGYDGVRIEGDAETAVTPELWEHLGYREVEAIGAGTPWVKLFQVIQVAESADRARALGARLATVLRAGDLVILTGDLGAGKTTFTQGLGLGLKVRGPVTSPTFVISRVHPSLVGGPALVHVDAYRIGGIDELDDLDLDASLDEAVTVVEWGDGVAEGLAPARLEVTISRTLGDDPLDDTDARQLRFVPVGGRWIGAGLRQALA